MATSSQVPAFAAAHRRYNPLTGEWVLVSAGRTSRPWQGQQEPPPEEARLAYDPDCYLCPGNERAGGARNPSYGSTFVFTNDFAALQPDVDEACADAHPLFQAHVQAGTCRVLCFNPRHDLTLAEMTVQQIRAVVDLWVAQVRDLAPRYPWVQVFENKGEAMGASNPHPHGQVWATTTVPVLPAREDVRQRAYHVEHGRPLLTDYADAEAEADERVVVHNDVWLAVVPYWAVWPFEVLVLPRRHVPRLPDLTDAERTALAATLQELLSRFDNLFAHPFPYSMGWHGAPGVDEPAPHWQLHAHVFPPLLRSASVRKFMVGYEMLAGPQRDLTPEEAAQRLRACAAERYRTAAS